MAAAWTPKPDNPITEVYLNPGNEMLAVVMSGGDGGIFLIDPAALGNQDVDHVPEEYRRIWP
jgi:hypothetical protein